MKSSMLIFLSLFFVVQCSHLIEQDGEQEQVLIKEGDSFSVLLNTKDTESTKNTESTEKLLEKNVSLHKETYQKVLSFFKKKEWDNSIQTIKDDLRKNPFDEHLLTLLATTLYNQGNYVSSMFYARLVLDKVNAVNAQALNLLGLSKTNTAKSLSDYLEAIEYFKKSFMTSKREIAAGLNLGYLQQETGQYEASLKTFTEVAERCEHCSSSLMGLVLAHSSLKQNEQAKDLLDEILEKEPSHTLALYQLALYYRNHEKNLSKAESILHAILENIGPDQIAMQKKVKLLLNASL